jgi:hypothetical protein
MGIAENNIVFEARRNWRPSRDESWSTNNSGASTTTVVIDAIFANMVGFIQASPLRWSKDRTTVVA